MITWAEPIVVESRKGAAFRRFAAAELSDGPDYSGAPRAFGLGPAAAAQGARALLAGPVQQHCGFTLSAGEDQ
jgi:hypothetical protein